MFAKWAHLEKVNRDKVVGVFNRTIVVHECHVPVICELHLDVLCCEPSMTMLVCLREEDVVGILVSCGDLHAKDDAGEIVSVGASGSKLDLRRKRHAV